MKKIYIISLLSLIALVIAGYFIVRINKNYTTNKISEEVINTEKIANETSHIIIDILRIMENGGDISPYISDYCKISNCHDHVDKFKVIHGKSGIYAKFDNLILEYLKSFNMNINKRIYTASGSDLIKNIELTRNFIKQNDYYHAIHLTKQMESELNTKTLSKLLNEIQSELHTLHEIMKLIYKS